MFKCFKNKNVLDNNLNFVSSDKNYNLILSYFDDLTIARLNSIELSLELNKKFFADLGLTLTELELYNDQVKIKRNQLGFYPTEIYSLKSNLDYDNYLLSKKVFDEYYDRLETINELITDKEEILSGLYKLKNERKNKEVTTLIFELGYGEARIKTLYEENPNHPSSEYNRLLKLLELINKNKFVEKVKEEVLEKVIACYRTGVRIELKSLNDKYNIEADDSYGVVLIDDNNGDIHMLYQVNNSNIEIDLYEKYLKYHNPFLEIYFRILSLIIKKEQDNLSNNDK